MLSDILENSEETLQTELCSSSFAWHSGATLRLPASPPISEIVDILHSNSQEFTKDERMRAFMLSKLISFDDIFESNTSCCLLCDIADAILWVKCK